MKPITIDSQLQSVLEHLNAARKDFSEAYTRITNEGAKNYSSMLRDFLTDIESAIGETSCLATSKIELDLMREYNIRKEENNMGQNVYADPQLQAAYEKGLKAGRVEGMIAYQKHLIENLQKENAVLVKRLEAERKSD